MGHNQHGSAWTDELRERVKLLWKTNSGSEIQLILMAEGYTFSRNSIMGLLHRAGVNLSDKSAEHPMTRRQGSRKTKPKPEKRNPYNIPRLRIIRANGNSNHLKVIQSFETEMVPLRCVEIVQLKLTTLENDGCEWIEGEDHLHCGHPKKEGSSYCVPHHHLCWTPAADPKQGYTPKAFERVSA